MLKKLIAVVQIMVIVLMSVSTFAQETTATLNGRVKESKGAFVSGATITIKHEPTGLVTTGQTNSKGIFVIPNLKVGGPYSIKISFVGFKEEVWKTWWFIEHFTVVLSYGLGLLRYFLKTLR